MIRRRNQKFPGNKTPGKNEIGNGIEAFLKSSGMFLNLCDAGMQIPDLLLLRSAQLGKLIDLPLLGPD